MSLTLETRPSGWTDVPIEDLFAPLEDGRTLHQGWSPQCEKEPSPGDDVWGVLRTTAIQAGAFFPEHNKLLPEKLSPRPLLEVKPGDLLITCAGPRARCGVACLVRNTRRRLMMSGKMYRFRLPDHVDPRYVEAYLQTSAAHADIDRMKTGGSDSGLNLTHDRFRRLQVPLAPRREQGRIVDEIDKQFTRLDAAVAAFKRVQANLKRYRAAVLKAASEGRLVPTEAELARKEGRPYETGEQLLARILQERRVKWEADQLARTLATGKPPKDDSWRHRYKEPEPPDTAAVPPLPEGWIWASLDQLICWGPQNGLYKPSTAYGEGAPIIRIEDYQFDRVPSREDLKLVRVAEEEDRTYKLSANDIVLNRVNSPTHLGKSMVVSDALAGVLFESNMMRFKISGGVVPAWLLVVLQTTDGRARLTANAKWAVNQASINQEDVKRTAVPLPPRAEQDRILDAVDTQLALFSHTVAEITGTLAHADRLRQSILKCAFEGKLVPQDPNDEPASVLLERIRAERAGTASRRTVRGGRLKKAGIAGAAK